MEIKLINYQGADYLTDLVWQDCSANTSSSVQKQIKEIIRRKKFDSFGLKNEKSKTEIQIGFASKEYKGEDVLASYFVSDKSFYNSLIVLKITDEKYWVCNITKNGKIEKEATINDSLLEESVSTIIDFSISEEGFSIFVLNKDLDFFEEKHEDYFESLGIEIKDFNIDDVLSAKGNFKVESVYNANADIIKNIGVLAIAIFGSFMVYQKVIKEDPLYESISNQEESISFFNQNNGYKNYIKKQEKENKNAFKLLAKEQLLKLHNITYTNDDIFNYMNKLYSDFPLYLVEWELNDINYVNNGSEFFRIVYKRIPNSFGFVDSLKTELKTILDKNGYNNYQISVPSSKGDVVYVEFMFKNKKEIKISQVDSEKIKKEIKKIDDKIKKVSTNIETIESSVLDLGFFDKRFGSVLEEKQDEILTEVNKGIKLIKKAKKERELLKVEDININENIISGSSSDMLNMFQSYSYYQWNETQQATKYPILQRRSQKRNEIIPYYAQSFNFEVGVGNNANLIGLEGLKTILENKNLLDKPYIIIKDVTFNLDTESWTIEGSYYEKFN